jgi:hypothetical protein
VQVYDIAESQLDQPDLRIGAEGIYRGIDIGLR